MMLRPGSTPDATTLARDQDALDVSVVMPCLNEADTIASCIEKAQRALREHGLRGEIIVADNGSTDGSDEIAARLGALVVHVPQRGYGRALMSGIEAARSEFIVMGDADDSYDFGDVPRFIQGLREGNDLVQGCRLPRGGGRIAPRAMPLLHRWWGNPMFSYLVRKMFSARVQDVYCGMRGFTKSLYGRLDLRSTGMEFATEMVIKASLHGERIAEIPITLYPDGRRSHPPHLKTFRDGWRTLRFFLMCSPRWLFLLPGIGLILAAILGYAVAMPRLTILGVTFDAHTLLFASLSLLLGYQSVLFAVFAKRFAISEGLLPPDPRLARFLSVVTLERALVAGSALFLIGIGLLMSAVNRWWAANFGELDYSSTMRWVIPGVMLTAVGFQTILSSFFLSILGMSRRP